MSTVTLHLLMLESNETDMCEWSLVTASWLKSGRARDRPTGAKKWAGCSSSDPIASAAYGTFEDTKSMISTNTTWWAKKTGLFFESLKLPYMLT